ncbi:hypothetical protein EF912_18855 [Streptomyces sp. WAC07061]|uniref:hypothetical protein n=1 Tax=Streptomyces sp. WAC07061 TaxID=2487410 RepID=UPI000F76F356|nr:hypothetical protein [Streptomyces sp. WAC07061]RSS52904.1 hypothetical protein EF912_18855 [Streptomyces sp. WAC07061]
MATVEDGPQVRDVAGGVRELLRGPDGGRTETKWRRGLRAGRESNVLFGVALHAAEARGQRALTDLEQSLMEMLTAVLTDAEITAAAAEYRSAVVDLKGDVAVLPTAVTSRPASQPFTLDDWWAHQPKVRSENASRANCATVDLATVATGSALDSPAFESAMGEVGFGATAVCGPPPEEADAGDEDRSYRAAFQLESFLCRRAVGDQWGGRDEIYWSVASRSDKNSGTVYTSPEFGRMEAGKTASFPADATIFNAAASNAMVVNVMVWEVDGSPGAWYEALKKGMRAWLDKPLWMDILSAAMMFVPLPGNTLPVDIAIQLTQLFVDLIGMIRNDNDLSCERLLVFDRNALLSLYHRKNESWEFNGDGWHSLRVKYVGERPLFPVGTVEYVTLNAATGAVSTPVSLGWKSAAPPALFSLGGKLHCLYIRPRDHAVMWAVKSNGVWTRPVQIRSFASQYRPALALNALGQIQAAIVAMDGRIVLSTYNPHDNTWSTTTPVPGRTTDRAPTLTRRPHFITRSLALVHRQSGGRLVMSTRPDGGEWAPTADASPIENWSTVHAPSNTTFQGDHWIAWADNGGALRLAYKVNSLYGSFKLVDGPHSALLPDGPALAAHDGALWLAVRSQNGTHHLYPRIQDNWDTPKFRTLDTGAMAGEPTLVSHAKQLHLAYRRP